MQLLLPPATAPVARERLQILLAFRRVPVLKHLKGEEVEMVSPPSARDS